MQVIKVAQVQLLPSGKTEVTRWWIARDAAHADRIIARRKAHLAKGSPISFTRQALAPATSLDALFA